MACAFIGLVASLLGLGAAKIADSAEKREHENWQRSNTITNIELQDKEEKRIASEIWKKAMAYIKQGLYMKDYLPTLYHEYGIPMKEEIESKTIRDRTEDDHIIVLIRQVTKKRMKSLGYNYSYTGMNSTWQEKEKENEAYRRTKQKYPWI